MSPPSRWRAMRPGDLDAVLAIAAVVHPTLPEDRAVFADRLSLAPGWCRLLGGDGGAFGYLIAHPWTDAAPPPLDTVLGRLPEAAPALCLHDLALLSAVRGSGSASTMVNAVLGQALAEGFVAAVLVAVGGSAGFWARFGFEPVTSGPDLGDYGADAVMMRHALRPKGR